MKIGLIDVDGHNFPNLPLMKISAWHKSKGDSVEWYEPLLSGHMDIVYMSKVFTFTDDYEWAIDADKIIKGGSGYCISLVDGVEVFDKSKDIELPEEIEHIYPDYSLYGITDTAYGFMTRGCPRGCGFCHVKEKEGLKSHKVAELSEFWGGQKYIELLDPNTFACKDWKEILQQLIESKAIVNFNQGVDIRLLTKEKIEMLQQVKIKSIHFAWDRYQDKDIILPKLKDFSEMMGKSYCRSKIQVYVLTNFDTTFEQDMERVLAIRSLNMNPYIMRYDKEHIPTGHALNKLARWCNARAFFWKYESFQDFLINEY